MAAANQNTTAAAPSWSLQTKHRCSIATKTPSAQCADIFGGSSVGNFHRWTNVPPVGVPDPYIADQVRPQRRVVSTGLIAPMSSHAPEPFAGGKLCNIEPQQGHYSGYGKRSFPELVGSRSTDERRAGGLKRVESRARSDEAALADPNTAVKMKINKVESVKMFKGTNQVDYHCWVPTELARAEKGDWNWNQSLGFRRVNMTAAGEPRRSLEHPVAWPGYHGYPPEYPSTPSGMSTPSGTRSAASNTRIDYSLKMNGRHVRRTPLFLWARLRSILTRRVLPTVPAERLHAEDPAPGRDRIAPGPRQRLQGPARSSFTLGPFGHAYY